MEGIVHEKAAKIYLAVAEEHDKKINQEKDINEKKAIRIVAAQNYFYCSVNVIEAMLFRDKKQHSFSHENRSWKVKENVKLFTDEIVELYDEVDRDLRNKVAYRGNNGAMYEKIRKLAKLLTNHYEK